MTGAWGFDRMMLVRERGAVKEAMLRSSCYAFVAQGDYCENQTDRKYSCFHFGFRRLLLRAGGVQAIATKVSLLKC